MAANKGGLSLPHLKESLDSPPRSKRFTTLGLKSRYQQVEVAEVDSEKTAFISAEQDVWNPDNTLRTL